MSTDSGKQKSNALEAIRTKEAHRATSTTISTEEGVAFGDKNDGDDARFSISNSHRNGGSHLELDHQKKACKTAGMTESVKTASTVTMNNGDVEMESENEEDEVSAPVGVMPEPKVGSNFVAKCRHIYMQGAHARVLFFERLYLHVQCGPVVAIRALRKWAQKVKLGKLACCRVKNFTLKVISQKCLLHPGRVAMVILTSYIPVTNHFGKFNRLEAIWVVSTCGT